MKKLLLLAAPFLIAAHCVYAAPKQSGTFTCTSGLSLPLTSFYLELQAPSGTGASPAASFVTITTDVTEFQSLFIDIATGKINDTCEVQVTDRSTASTPLKFLDVAAMLVSVTGEKGSEFVTATFSFAKVEDLQTNNTTAVKSAVTLTPEQKNKALTQFLARAPKPSAN